MTSQLVRSPVGDATGVVTATPQRLASYRRTLQDTGVPCRPEHVMTGAVPLDAARAHVRLHLQGPGRPTAVFATHSTLSLAELWALRGLGLRCLDGVSVAYLDDAERTSAARPRLSVMAQPAPELGTAATRRPGIRVGSDRSARRIQNVATARCPRASIGAPTRQPGGAGSTSRRRSA